MLSGFNGFKWPKLLLFAFDFPVICFLFFAVTVQVLTPSSGFLDFAISMRPDYHQAIIDTIQYYGWEKVIYIYDSHDGRYHLTIPCFAEPDPCFRRNRILQYIWSCHFILFFSFFNFLYYDCWVTYRCIQIQLNRQSTKSNLNSNIVVFQLYNMI